MADHFVTQMRRQGDAAVFKRYSQAKLNMMREALTKLDRQANEHSKSFGTVSPKQPTFGNNFGTVRGLSHDQSADDNDGNAGRKRVKW